MRIDRQVDEIRRHRSLGDQVFIGLHNRLVQIGTAEIPPVDEKELRPRCLASRLGGADVTTDADDRRLGGEVHHRIDRIRSQQVLDPVFQGFGRLEHVDVAAVVGQGEADFRPGQGNPGEFFYDVFELYIVRLEEFPSGRHVVEEITDRKITAFGCSGLDGREMLGIGEFDLAADRVFGPAGPQRHFGNRGNRSEGFSPEAEGLDRLQVFRCRNLGSGVAGKAELRLGRRHPAAVVDDLYQGPAGIGDDDGHLIRPGIDGILHQLLDHGSGTLHDLAGSDHVRDITRQDPDVHPLQQRVELRDVEQDDQHQDEADQANDGLCLGRTATAGIIAVTPGTLDIGTGSIFSLFFSLAAGTAIDLSEHLATLLFLRIVINRLVIEDPVFLVSEKTESCHNGYLSVN